MTNQSTEQPRYEHDCSTCVFLGRHGDADLYFHAGTAPIFTTVIARHGEHGNYSSGLFASRPYLDIAGRQQQGNPELVEARRRAIESGYGPQIAKAENARFASEF